jgi:hypothetical protein
MKMRNEISGKLAGENKLSGIFPGRSGKTGIFFFPKKAFLQSRIIYN